MHSLLQVLLVTLINHQVVTALNFNDTFVITSNDRTLDLASIGIDLGSTFDQLLSPSGIVNQFALTIIIQLCFIIGYIISGRWKISYQNDRNK